VLPIMCFRLRLRDEASWRRKPFGRGVVSMALMVSSSDMVTRKSCSFRSNGYASGNPTVSVGTVTTDRFWFAETSAQFERKSPSKLSYVAFFSTKFDE
jgi:hypothetical protein